MIAYLLGSLNRGGTETLLLDVFRNARTQGLDAIGIYRKSGLLEKEFLKTGIKLFRLNLKSNPFKYIFQLRNLLLQNNIEIVHAQQPIDALAAYIACLNSNQKLILTLHAYDFNDNFISKKILNFIIKRTHLNIYVSNSQKEYYIKQYNLKPEFQTTIYNGISFDKLDSTNQSNIKTEINLKQNQLLFGTVGNFVPGRDQFTICKFLFELKKQEIDFKFIFIGKKNEQTPARYDQCVDYIKAKEMSDRVYFLGSRNDVPELLNQLDAFIYSTEHDTFGIAVVEALACGLPVFVNNWDVMNEITENGKLATLYISKNENDLLNHFLLFLQNKKSYISISDAAKRTVRQRYSIEEHITQLKYTYSDLLNKYDNK